jgi:hypothetical protein
MTWAVHQNVLGRPDVPIHEAGHYVAAGAIGLPADWPEVFAKPNDDGANGRVIMRFDLIPPPTRQLDIPDGLFESVGFDLAAMHLAGHCAEAIAKKTHWVGRVIGAGSPDMKKAVQILSQISREDCLWDCWQRSREILEQNWAEVHRVAERLRKEIS